MMFYFFKALILLVLVSIIEGLNAGYPEEECRTPDGTIGKCVPIKECYSLLLGIRSKDATTIELAKKSQCGYYDSNPFVCCEKDKVIELSKHQKLLPQTDVCGWSHSDRIIGGVVAGLDGYRWSVALEYKKKATGENVGLKCTGSLINKRYVLTSASCLSDGELELTNVRLGEWDTSVDPDCEEFAGDKICADPVKSVKISKEVKHPNYNGDEIENNIGLIRMEQEAVYGDFIRPVCLPHMEIISDVLENSTLVVSGWGTLKNAEKSSRLHYEHAYKISNDDCNEKSHGAKQFSDSESCLFSYRSSFESCLINKGSPVVKVIFGRADNNINFYQVGVVMWTKECGADYPIVYANVLDFMPWILDTISEE